MKNIQRRGQCIFCNGFGLSKEHIWPDWMSDYIPKISSHNNHLVSNSAGAPVSDTFFEKGKLMRPGAPHSQKLRIVCRQCNNGWMSKLQTDAKPIITALIADDWMQLTGDEQRIFIQWAAMFTMVWEFAHPQTAGVTNWQRYDFQHDRRLPRNWITYVGRLDAGAVEPITAHFGGQNHHLSLQTTVACVGKLIFQTFYVSGPPLPDQRVADSPMPVLTLTGSYVVERPDRSISLEEASTRYIQEREALRTYGEQLRNSPLSHISW